jgi:hypothetical protein
VDEDEDMPRGDELPCRPWWLTEEGVAQMRALEAELDQLESEINGSLQGH